MKAQHTLPGPEEKTGATIPSHPIPSSYFPNQDQIYDGGRTYNGANKRGKFHESYFSLQGRRLAGRYAYYAICNGMKESGRGVLWISENPHTELMTKCAKRENTDRCDYYNIGRKLSACAECEKENKKMWYCGVEHYRKGWKLHKFTCEKKTTANAEKK
ncbi:hypothetical protein BOTCAL_0392g00070 [Botryotinia calthae]|uniref:MYND-type domain-containing protein n=1 Tax=Botryotinia calthae TaxID=38488 RepID=A0A4Y8CQU1_9HELO|nr:hypothetical protein BOTCAL_0392g00070 [Botryotinia calthae]